ncbi:peptidoglycan editing factor PgeF [Luteimonas sp. RD2P54]|uniref:Purine nucleoside phosphorylase n=1 Tax=Luteimonas endophytica TaxID=3042023 RepID=A0ABT6J6W1_9GAMM|nr:peptidoglycan editing factor PgeF [Luteimonas endophytica]MDH5822307.1 peptidoglycan editing factor PgeF [Luteimonas endophytica]
MSAPDAEPAILRAAWPAPPGVVAFTTLRRGAGVSAPPFDDFNLGAHCGDDPAAVARNRAELERRFGLPGPPCWLRQVHGTAVQRWDRPGPSPARVAGPRADLAQHGPGQAAGSGARGRLEAGAGDLEAGSLGDAGPPDRAVAPEADGSVTADPGTVLAVLTADCLPVVLAAADGSEVAAVHAGWRGLAAGVLEAALAELRTPAGAVRAWLGPAAGPRAYEVDAAVREAFLAVEGRAAEAFVATRPGHWFADLYALARMRLAAAGMAPGDIHGGAECTISDPARFFSHRRDGRGGRMATVVYRAR